MARFKIIIATSGVALALASGIAFAQNDLVAHGRTIVGPSRNEIVAAQHSLADAIGHLQRADNSNSTSVKRAYAYMMLAQSELQGGAQPLQPAN